MALVVRFVALAFSVALLAVPAYHSSWARTFGPIPWAALLLLAACSSNPGPESAGADGSSGATSPTSGSPTSTAAPTSDPTGGAAETSTEIGLGVPLGLDVLLGPGRLFAEGQILWSAVAQRSTGESNLGALTLSAGYRLVL